MKKNKNLKYLIKYRPCKISKEKLRMLLIQNLTATNLQILYKIFSLTKVTDRLLIRVKPINTCHQISFFKNRNLASSFLKFESNTQRRKKIFKNPN